MFLSQIDQQIEDMFASVKRVTDIAKPQVISNPAAGIGALPPGQSNQQKLALAKQLAAKINMAKKIGPDARDITQQAAKFILSDEGFAPKVAVSLGPLLLLELCPMNSVKIQLIRVFALRAEFQVLESQLSQLTGHECWIWVKICSPSLLIKMFPYLWKISEWDKKKTAQAFKKS